MFATKTNKTKSIVTIAASLVAGALLLAGSGLADANDKGRRSHDAQPRLVEGSGAGIRQEGTQKDRDIDTRTKTGSTKTRSTSTSTRTRTSVATKRSVQRPRP